MISISISRHFSKSLKKQSMSIVDLKERIGDKSNVKAGSLV